jgi:hypothetical protein
VHIVLEKVFDGDFFLLIKPHLSEGLVLFINMCAQSELKKGAWGGQVKDPTARVQHEASTSKIGKDQIFYFQQRGIDCTKAVSTLMGGFCHEVFKELPLELAFEVNQLMRSKLAD